MISRQTMETYPPKRSEIFGLVTFPHSNTPSTDLYNPCHPIPLRIIRLGRTFARDHRFPPWKERPFARQHPVHHHTQAQVTVSLGGTQALPRTNLVEKSAGVVVPRSFDTEITRVKPKSARMAWGGVKSVMVVFGWEHVNYTIRSFVRVGGLTALTSCAMLRLRRYLIPLIQKLHSGERRGGLMLGTGGISKLTRRN
jgi:hypothetical protein